MSIIKESKGIKLALKQRIKELNLKPSAIVDDAQSRGLPLSKSTLSNFLNDKDKGTPSDEIIVWLCIRYGIKININISKIPYIEKEALKVLKQVYPQYTEVHG